MRCQIITDSVGKTLTTLALVMATKNDAAKSGESRGTLIGKLSVKV